MAFCNIIVNCVYAICCLYCWRWENGLSDVIKTKLCGNRFYLYNTNNPRGMTKVWGDVTVFLPRKNKSRTSTLSSWCHCRPKLKHCGRINMCRCFVATSLIPTQRKEGNKQIIQFPFWSSSLFEKQTLNQETQWRPSSSDYESFPHLWRFFQMKFRQMK